ncbi:hypothetical protein ACPV5U_27955 [Vibrio mediterranei]
MSLKHLIGLFGLVTDTDHERLKRKSMDQLSNCQDEWRMERKMRRQLQKEIGSYLLLVGELTKASQYDTMGRKLRLEEALSPDEIADGTRLFCSWLESEIETKQQQAKQKTRQSC